jgi:hypothetical protein
MAFKAHQLDLLHDILCFTCRSRLFEEQSAANNMPRKRPASSIEINNLQDKTASKLRGISYANAVFQEHKMGYPHTPAVGESGYMSAPKENSAYGTKFLYEFVFPVKKKVPAYAMAPAREADGYLNLKAGSPNK